MFIIKKVDNAVIITVHPWHMKVGIWHFINVFDKLRILQTLQYFILHVELLCSLTNWDKVPIDFDCEQLYPLTRS